MNNWLAASRRRVQGDDGNMMLFFLVLLVTVALATVALGTVYGGAISTRHDTKYTQALPPADSGVQQALYKFNNDGTAPTSVPAPPTSCSNPAPTGSAPQWGAVQDVSNPLVWHVTSIGCSNGLTRKITADLVQQPRFSVGAFAEQGAGTHGTSSGVTSYGGNGHLGTIGTNGSVSFTGNPSVDKIMLFNYQGNNANPGRCDGQPCSYTDTNNPPSNTIVYTVTDPYPVTQADVPPGSPDPNQFIHDQLNACEAVQGSLQPWVASQHNYTLVNTGTPQCYSSVTFDDDTTISGATSANPLQLYVSGNVTMTKNHQNVNFTGNTTPDASAFQIYTAGATVSFTNQSAFVGLIWAPFATCAGQTSSASSDIYGSMVCGTIDNQGGWNFHWDESLAFKLGLGQWRVANYSEQ
jgi:hypothetical protein